MKKLFSIFLSGLAIASTTLSFQSCADEYDPAIVTKHDLTVNQYTENFIKHYGEIDPNHTWGFGEVKQTRTATTRANLPNKNEWWNTFNGHIDIPGYPDNFKKKNSDGTITYATYGYHYGDGPYNYSETRQGNPCGDVTDEEIQYVSWWFRTHNDPGNQQVHFTDFFIQEISSDVDRNADGTKNDNVIEYHYNADGTKKSQQDDHYENFAIDQLRVKTFDGSTTAGDGMSRDGFDHIYNFNWGKSNKLGGYNSLPMTEADIYTDDTYSVRNIGFYTSSGTEDFDAHYSNDQTWRDSNQDVWRMVHLTWVGPSGRMYDGWYIGFDYAFYKKDTEQDGGYKIQERIADKYFSNWILKLTPANGVHPTDTKRVMCEDLGNTYDFDFNDVVFDVTYNMNNLASGASGAGADIEVLITIQAAGGTMPIYVGSTDEKYEAHKLLGQTDTSTPVNVGGKEHSTANYRIKGDFSNPANIPVYVKTSNGSTYTLTVHNLKNNYTGSVDNDHNTIKHDANDAPQKFCVPCTVQWMKEEMFIETGYNKFPDWVKDDTGCGSYSSNPWYNTISDASKIYKYVNTQVVDEGSFSNPVFMTAPQKVALTINAGNGGQVQVYKKGESTPTDSRSFATGTELTLVATPNNNYVFSRWNDGNTSATRDITVDGNSRTYTAEFSFDESKVQSLGNVSITEGISISDVYGQHYIDIDASYFNSISLSNEETLRVQVTINYENAANANGKVEIPNCYTGEHGWGFNNSTSASCTFTLTSDQTSALKTNGLRCIYNYDNGNYQATPSSIVVSLAKY